MLQSVVSTFDAHVSQTNASVRNVVDATWEGEDATAFEASWQQFQGDAAALRAVLESLIGRLYQAEGTYGMTETGLSGAFAQNQNKSAVRPQEKKNGLGAAQLAQSTEAEVDRGVAR